MPSGINPQNFKRLSSNSSAPDIVSCAGSRKPRTSQIFCGGSDFSVYELDLDQAKPEPIELGRHDSYVTGLALAGNTLVSGGYDGRLIWWDIDSRSRVRDVSCSFEMDPPRGGDSRWQRRRQRGRRHGLPVLGCLDRPLGPRVARPRRADAGSLPLDAVRSGHYPLTAAASPRVTRSGTSSSGTAIRADRWPCSKPPELYTWDPVQRRHSIGGIRAVGVLSRRPLSRSWRQRPDFQHRSSGRPGAGGSIRLAEGRAARTSS